MIRMGTGAWWQGATVYHIYPLSFYDADGDGYGDLPGITRRLDHLAGEPASLGVDAIWLSPIYLSPMVDFGYDIADHCDVDPRFGTLADAEALVDEAHRRGLRVLLDFVPNHTSDRHPWFQQSRRDRANAFRDFYIWADPAADGGPPNNWRSAFASVGPAWTLDPPTGQYYLHSYTPQQPDLNWRNTATREAMHDVLRFWLDRGVDGFRVDAPHRLAKDSLLRDNPADVETLLVSTQTDDRRHRNIDQDDVHELLRGIRRVVDSYPGTVLVGEVGVRHPQRRLAYQGSGGDELQLIFDFGFWECPWSAEAFRRAGERLHPVPDPDRWPTHALSNHDISRHASRYAHAGAVLPRARVAAVLLLTLPGTAFLYYGEEIGMTDVAVPVERAKDPDGRDGCRTPMQWDRALPSAGFSTGEPWLPVGASGDVASQRDDPGSLLALYRSLLDLRRTDRRLTRGTYRAVESGPDVSAFVRELAGEALLVVLNFAAEPRRAALSPPGRPLPDRTRVLVSSAGPGRDRVLVPGRLTLAGDEALVLDLGGG